MSIDSRQKLEDVISQMMQPPSGMFIKGLKNAHSLATHIYEKGPQMLSNAISEVKKP